MLLFQTNEYSHIVLNDGIIHCLVPNISHLQFLRLVKTVKVYFILFYFTVLTDIPELELVKTVSLFYFILCSSSILFFILFHVLLFHFILCSSIYFILFYFKILTDIPELNEMK